jgi:hypothetical protein
MKYIKTLLVTYGKAQQEGPSSSSNPRMIKNKRVRSTSTAIPKDDSLWPGGRLRALVFGYGGSWVLYRNQTIEYNEPLHIDFRRALELGKKKGWSINVSFNYSSNSKLNTKSENCS